MKSKDMPTDASSSAEEKDEARESADPLRGPLFRRVVKLSGWKFGLSFRKQSSPPDRSQGWVASRLAKRRRRF